METKPFSLQSPEAIAKEYGGNKLKIAQAAQNGLVDPTAAVLAGMFIDRMRSAAAQEQVPQQTVAQQVLGPQTPPPPQMPQAMSPMGGPGMPPPGGMPPQGGMGMPPPQPQPQQPPMPMMSAGGVAMLDVPDDLYEYGGGGLVAFQRGDSVVDERERARLKREMLVRFKDNPEVMRRLEGLSADEMRQVLGEVQVSPVSLANLQAEDTTPQREMFSPEANSAIDRIASGESRSILQAPQAPQEAPAPTAQPVAMQAPQAEPVPAPAQGLAALAGAAGMTPLANAVAAPTEAVENTAAQSPEGLLALQEYRDQIKALMPAKTEEDKVREQYYKDAPERNAARGKEDFWNAVTQFGFNLAGTKSPYFMQAAGQAGTATMPFITESMKGRRTAEEAAIKARGDISREGRAEEMKAVEQAIAMRDKELTRQTQREVAETSAGKLTDMRDFVGNHVAAQRAVGDERPEPILRREGAVEYLQLYGAAGLRGQAAVTQAGAATTRVDTDLRDRSRDNVDRRLASYSHPNAQKLRELRKADRRNKTNTVDDYVKQLYADELAELQRLQREQGGGAGGQTSSGATTTQTAGTGTKASPITLPPNAKQESLQAGKYYTTPRGVLKWDGKQFVAD
jgi:hypothetical protein